MAALEENQKRRRAWRGMAIRIGGSAVILALLFAFLPVADLWAAMRRVPPSVFAAVLLIYLCAHFAATLKWRMVVNAAGAAVNVPQAALCYFTGLFGNVFLPSIVGGDVIRAGLAMRAGGNRAGAVLGSLLDRMLDVAALAGVALVGALLLPGALDDASRRVFWMLAGVAVAGVAIGGVALALVARRRFSFKIRRRLVKIRQAVRSVAAQPQRISLAFVMSMMIQSTFVLLTAWIAGLCGLNLPLRVWLFAWPLAKITALLPVTQGGIGVREVALAALLKPFGAPVVLTVAVGLVWEVVIISGGLAGGMISLLVRGRASRQVAGTTNAEQMAPQPMAPQPRAYAERTQ